jgi:hypothetical protein
MKSDLKIQKINVNLLKPAEYNPRNINDEELAGLITNIKEFGYVDPIIVNKDLTIIGGHQRLKAVKELGYEEVDCVILDITKAKEKALNIALNNREIQGNYDYSKLQILIEEIKIEMPELDLKELKIDDLIIKTDLQSEMDAEVEGSVNSKDTIRFTFDHQTYLTVKDQIISAKEKLGCDTDEEVLLNILNEFLLSEEI